jgi:hypothetical protein
VLSAHLRLLAHQLLALGLSLFAFLLTLTFSPSHTLTPSHPLSPFHSLTLSPPRPSWRTGKHPRFRTPFWYSSDIRKVELQCKRELRQRPDFLASRSFAYWRPGAGILLDGPRWDPLEALPITLGAPSSIGRTLNALWTLDTGHWTTPCGDFPNVELCATSYFDRNSGLENST